jgi:hypothetical protein
MSRYFFHVFDGRTWSRDDEGDEFPDVAAAIQEAALIARELLDDDPRVNEADFRMEVADEHGNDVHVIRPQDVSNQLPIRRRLKEPENECGSCDVQLL